MRQIETIRGSIRLAISEGVLPRETNVDRLTLTALSVGVLKRFHEGFHGDKLTENMRKAAELRRENPEKYETELRENAQHLDDLAPLANEIRLIEALTTTDLSLGLAWTRADAATQRDYRPAFKTDLLDPAFTTRRTVDNLTPVESRGGVRLADTFLRRRAEASNVAYTSFEVTDGYYTVDEFNLALNFTNEMKMKDKYGKLQDAAYEMGQAAARTRALTVLEAIIQKAPRLLLPDAGFGPNISNLEAVVAHLSDLTIDGVNYSSTLSDLFVSGAWAVVANTAISTPTIVSGVNGLTVRPNPIYQVGGVHNEQILTLAPWAQEWGIYGLDRKTWFGVDRDAKPFEFATMRGFESGPKTLVEVPHTAQLDLGSFDNHLFRIKVTDYAGADVSNPAGVVLVPGSATAPERFEF